LIKYCTYNKETGEIELVGGASSQEMLAPDVLIHPGVIHNHWIDITTTPHTLMAKTQHPLTIDNNVIYADGEEECVITGIHNPSTVTWPDGFIETVTDGEIRLSVDLAGEYAITIEAIPYLTETINVQAITPA
jgi:hypothetical protein